MENMNHTIQQMADLPRLRKRSRAVGIVVALPELEDAENALWQARLRRRAQACGCNEGAAAGLLVLIALAGWAAARWLWLGELPGILQGMAALAAVFAATGAGKGLGLALAEYRWRQDLAELERLLKGRF